MQNRDPKTGGLKHGLIMLLCCLVPIAVLAIMWAAGVSSNYLFFGVVLLCPILHLVMMTRMNRGKGGGHIH